jgi:hypothetical protein
MANAIFAQAPPAAPDSADPFHRLLDAYLDGKWDEVETMFAAPAREVQSIPAAEQPKVNYMRQTLSDGRPTWWKRCQAGEKFAFSPNVWGRAVKATFDPAAKSGIQLTVIRGELSIALAWPSADMDNPAPAEHGFSKGDLSSLSIWSTLGMAEAWSAIPLAAQTNLKEDAKVRLQQYLDFRGNVTGVYYGNPRARRWGLWLFMAMYMDKYAQLPVRASREAIAVMFMSEVAGNPTKYPSIPLPGALPAEGAEEKLAAALRGRIEKHGWTLVEDKYLRDAIAAFATANGRQVHLNGQVTLANGLVVALDPEKDKALRPKRDLWFKAKLDATVKTP